eukprot:m51a1_g6378 hypothetical protein (557) ;mRNA; r:144972-147122
MGSFLAKFFVDPTTIEQPTFYAVVQILFLMLCYGFVLCKASALISDGSELLLLVPAVSGIVGSVVLPVLGAVPDGAIVLFSGLGPDAQQQLGVGVGALAGSTVMLLTVPWILTLIAGRVSIVDGVGQYHARPKLAPPNSWHLWDTGVTPKPSVRVTALIMVGTAVSYLIIQGPAFFVGCSRADESCSAEGEHWWAMAGMVVCLLCFAGNLAYQFVTANRESTLDLIEEAKRRAIDRSLISLSAAFAQELFGGAYGNRDETTALIHDAKHNKRFEDTLRAFFHRHDRDGNGVIDRDELWTLLAELNERPAKDEFERLVQSMDANHDGVISFDEFRVTMLEYVHREYLSDTNSNESVGVSVQRSDKVEAAQGKEEGDEEGEEEEEEVPEDLKHLTPAQQQMRIIWRATWMMALGVGLVLVFSDPMVDVMSNLGDRLRIPPFYVAFVLAPIASNASELIAAVNYAKKKTVKTITISFESLVGAAVMNNTFSLGIFLVIVFARDLAWEFSAETAAILFVELCMVVIATRRVQRLGYGIVVASLYPLALVLVWVLEKCGYN